MAKDGKKTKLVKKKRTKSYDVKMYEYAPGTPSKRPRGPSSSVTGEKKNKNEFKLESAGPSKKKK